MLPEYHPNKIKGYLMDNNTVYKWILPTAFTIIAREQSFAAIKPYLSSFVRTGDNILDLCCGSGYASFWFEKLGARVTGIDIAPYMIELAREEATQRDSTVVFVEADIFQYELDQERYELISCFGNSISDFALSDFSALVKLVFKALKPGGRFILQYHDGLYKYLQGKVDREGIYQETPERVTFHFKQYLPENLAIVNTIRNETLAVEYDRQGYLYAVPIVHCATGKSLSLEKHIILGTDNFLDIFIKDS